HNCFFLNEFEVLLFLILLMLFPRFYGYSRYSRDETYYKQNNVDVFNNYRRFHKEYLNKVKYIRCYERDDKYPNKNFKIHHIKSCLSFLILILLFLYKRISFSVICCFHFFK